MSGQLQITQRQLDDFENVQAARLTIDNFDLKVVPGNTFTVEGTYDVRNVGGTVATEISVSFGGHGARASIDKMELGKSTITPSPDGFSLGPGSVHHFPTGRAGNGSVADVVGGSWTNTYEIEVGYRDIFNRPHIVTGLPCLPTLIGPGFLSMPIFSPKRIRTPK